MARKLAIRVVFVFLACTGLSFAQEDCNVDHLCFAMDQSGSIKSIYPDVQQFTADAATAVHNLSPASYSAVGFSNSFEIISAPTSNLNKFVNAVTAPDNVGGSTNMYAGVNQCYDYIENKPGNRVIVLVTDGRDSKTPSAETLIQSKASSGVYIVSVGIGSGIDENYLKSLSDVYIPVATSDIDSVAETLSTGICEAPEVSENPTPTKAPMPTKTPMVSTSCGQAYKMCDFKFANTNSVLTYTLNAKADTVFTGRIVSKMMPRIGLLNMNDIVPEFIANDGTVTPITSIGNPTLTPTHFKPFQYKTSGGSGISHETFTGNQLQSSKGRCLRVYFSTYQTLSDGLNPSVVDNINVGKSDNKCVVFKLA